MKRLTMVAIALLCSAPATAAHAVEEPSQVPSVAPLAPESISMARYHGEIIDLREGWGTAHACHVSSDAVTTCFDSEAQMDAATGYVDVAAPADLHGARRSTCASTLKLYDGISYTNNVVQVDLRLTVIDLSSLSFDNATTSYKVGVCSAIFWQGPGGSGTVYPGNTSAGAQSPNMVTGWNNTVSSVYLS